MLKNKEKGLLGPWGGALFATGQAELVSVSGVACFFSSLFIQQPGSQFPSQESQGSNPNPNPNPNPTPPRQGKSQELSFEARNYFHPSPRTPSRQIPSQPETSSEHLVFCPAPLHAKYCARRSTEKCIYSAQGSQGGSEREEGRSECGKKTRRLPVGFLF